MVCSYNGISQEWKEIEDEHLQQYGLISKTQFRTKTPEQKKKKYLLYDSIYMEIQEQAK